MTPEMRTLVDQRASLVTKMQENAKKGASRTSEEREAFNKMSTDEAQLRTDIEQLKSAEDLASEMRSVVLPPVAQPGNPDAAATEARSKQQMKELRGYLAYNLKPTSLRTTTYSEKEIPAEFRDMSVGTNSAGGYLVPTDFQKELEVATLAFGQSLGLFRSLHTDSGEALQWPMENDTANYAVPLAEAGTVTEQDATLSQATINTEMYSTKMVKISQQLLQDAAIDPVQIIKDALAVRLARGLVVGTTNGTSSTYTQGLLVSGTVASGQTITATGTGGTLTTPQYADIVKLYGSIDPTYRENATWMFSNSWFSQLLGVTDTLGRPLFIPNPNGDGLDRILGRPICINQSFPALAASANVVLFGDFSKYILRSVGGFSVVRLDERFADQLQVAFLGFQRFGGIYLDAGTHPIWKMKLAAS